MSFVPPEKQKQIMGHPVGLFVLFFTEMWERFSFYGMRALLILYMTKFLILEAEKGKELLGYSFIKSIVLGLLGNANSSEVTVQMISSQIYGLYVGMVYFTPLFGGILADRVLGQRKSVYLGGVLMAIGHFLMAIESLFFVALLFIVLGCGCFKPNISTQVGSLYAEKDPRRDGAFVIFYQGINLGAFLAPLICGTLGQKFGYHYGFAAAGVGMIAGLFIYHFGKKYLPIDAGTQAMKESKAVGHTDEVLSSQDIKRLFALVFLAVVNVLFWSVFEQKANTLMLWVDKNVDWIIAGITVPSSWYMSLNPFFIITLAPVLSRLWAWQNSKGREPHTVSKMGIGSLLLGASFLALIYVVSTMVPGEKVSLFWPVMMVLFLSLGELYVSPVGLSLVTRVAPARMVSMIMGMWFLTFSAAGILSGKIGSKMSTMSQTSFFTLLGGIAFGAGLIFFLAKNPLKKIMGDKG